MKNELTPVIASRFARAALGHVTREYPNKLDHVMSSADDVKKPSKLHPIFFGSFDWHSCVHGYWLLATLLREFPALPEAPVIRELFDAQITRENVAREVAYLEQPLRETFERPYGWAWLLMLAAEFGRLAKGDEPRATGEAARATSGKRSAISGNRESTNETTGRAERRTWSATLEPLTAAFVKRFFDFLPKATYPVRVGTHFNSAFAIALAFEFAEAAKNEAFAELLRKQALGWYRDDADCQAWEPGDDDFLSSALIEAECMRRMLRPEEFEQWFSRFLPRIAQHEPATLFRPATVTDRTDGKIAHLDGLNLSRAWCWRSLAKSWRETDPRRAIALAAADAHLAASMPFVTGDYMGEHWLATFAVLALRA